MAQNSGITRQVADHTIQIADGSFISNFFPLAQGAGFAVGFNSQTIGFTGAFGILHSLTPDGPYKLLFKRDYTGLSSIDLANVTKDVWLPAPTDVYELAGYIKLARYTDNTLATPVSSGDWSIEISVKG